MENLKDQIAAAVDATHVEILDPRKDGVHLEAIVVAKKFENAPLLARHRLVMNSLKQNFKEDLHALALKTYTPDEWEAFCHDK